MMCEETTRKEGDGDEGDDWRPAELAEDGGAGATADLRTSNWQIASSVLPFLAMWPLMFAAFRVSYWLVVPLALVTGGFWIRTFIVFHDCCHGSFFEFAHCE